jgi:alpha-beta hydrolase superfamily lysophospholipase
MIAALLIAASLLVDDLPRRGWLGPPRDGERIVRIGDRDIHGPRDAALALSGLPAGAEVAVDVVKGGERVHRKVKLDAWPREQSEDFETLYGAVEAEGRKLRTVLTRPKGKGPFPAVLFVQGIGCFSVDNVPFKYSYRTMTDALTRRGFATLRVDKPGAGDSEGRPCAQVGFDDEVRAYQAALAAFSQLELVDRERLYLFGHSMGGVMAPLIAQAAKVAGVAVFGTVYGSWLAYELEQGHRQDLLSGKDPAEVARLDALRERFVSAFYVDNVPLDELALRAPDLMKELELPPDGKSYAGGKQGTYVQEAYRAPLTKAWMDYGGRVLALFGSSDFVSSRGDHERLVEEVNSRRPGAARLVILEGVDHWFNGVPSMKESLKLGPDGEMSPRTTAALIEFFSTGPTTASGSSQR